MTTSTIRDVLAIDGEGRDLPDGSHIYTLLNSYDSKVGKQRYIENAKDGLSTWEILDFLLWLRCGRGTIAASYFFNYDVAMWLKDLPDAQKTILWKSGQLVAEHDGRFYYLRYIPSKLFFVGSYRPEFGKQPDEYRYPGRHLRLYDVSGFAQRSFVKALSEWDIPLPGIAEMKEQRGTFTAKDARRVRLYCQAECKALAQYVQSLDVCFQDEGITLHAWYGGGALAAHFLQQHGVEKHVKDPTDEGAYAATLSAYFGGRAELCHMGHLTAVLDYDISSAYPAASLTVPDLTSGEWRAVDTYTSAPYALWHVSWDTRNSGRRLGPLPFRYRKGVYYPDVGTTWIHACELATARRYYGEESFRVTGGWVYTVRDKARDTVQPFDFVRELAERRVRYKATNPRRAVPYKFGLNSIYGKLAQHAVDEGRTPPYQCYYAAGLITAYTRAQLLSFVYEDGQDDADIVLLATDGVFCQRERSWHVADDGAERLGYFGTPICLEDAYFVQPGCWYSRDGTLRSRGFGAKSLDYARVAAAWECNGLHSSVDFSETRFVGLGTCAGSGNYDVYARWIRDTRTLTFYPDRKFPAPGYTGREETVPLVPYSFPDRESEQYVPASLRDTRGYVEHLAELLGILYDEDQPDFPDM